MALRSDAANKNEEDEQDLNAECNAFSGHLRHLLLLEHSGSIFLAVVVIFVRDCDAEKNADDERDGNEDHPCKERHPIVKRTCLQKRKHEEQEESEEHHGDTSFFGEK